ncbi:hypothetical protein DYBT9623_04488 [Dyadobacter sp. CECT 9623]|uniref:Lipoprotein n=1 Tax=Dyadobacter linearis TaxID=2823330 RepID=A0ABN7RCK2_9BACT|nr:hypothetical protein [Dyadobacter sp. CECT 9623]CAG5072953.1 hypothetical protein DYBT9623_04488 [Dyadobacter sp. CECT 9623]
MKAVLPSTLFFILLFCSCSSSKKLKSDAESIASYKIPPTPSGSAIGLPSEAVWNKNHKEFIELIETYRDNNEKARKKNRTASTIFKISGAVIGLGGGILGIALSNSATASSITSLVSGASAGLVASFGIDKKTEATTGCYTLLNGIILQLKNIQDAPDTPDEYTAYLTKRDGFIDQIQKADCYGF